MFETHQLEGVDPVGRMFSRDIVVDMDEEGYRGVFRYEEVSLNSGPSATVAEVLTEVAKKLQKKNFQQIRTRLNFREDRYYAERETWIYYKG